MGRCYGNISGESSTHIQQTHLESFLNIEKRPRPEARFCFRVVGFRDVEAFEVTECAPEAVEDDVLC
jgi:hypothetical protein